MFPDADAWVASGQMGKYPPAEREKCFKFYERALQKVLWRRGNGRTLLSKSHLIEFMFTLEEKIPSATFVGTVRNPKDTFVSWYVVGARGSEGAPSPSTLCGSAAEHLCGQSHVRPSACAAEHVCGRARLAGRGGGFGGSPPDNPRFCPLLPQMCSSTRCRGALKGSGNSDTLWSSRSCLTSPPHLTVPHPPRRYGLAQAASKVMGGGWCLATKDAVDVHLRFWDLFSEAEMKFWGDEKKNKILVPFNDYIKDQDATVRKIYKGMDVKVEADFEKALRDDAERHANYKEKRAYKNDTLEELGTSGDAVEKRMRRYIDFFKL
jgi:hypothetical protein